jgi:ergothioneine biosynthesis protein EgtB
MPHTDTRLNLPWQEAHAARTATAPVLAELLHASRARTLALVDAYVATLGPQVVVPYSGQLNPPLWELGHMAWFQEFWTTRNPQRHGGHQADPLAARTASRLPQSDGWYNSSEVTHPARWHLPLPDLQATQDYLHITLRDTLECLAHEPHADAALYFYRLALLHEDMHGEAAVYMAQALGIPIPANLCRTAATAPPKQTPLRMAAGTWQLGRPTHAAEATDNGFAFDNELAAHPVPTAACEIDPHPVTWRRFLDFVDAGGYANASHWTPEGWAWREQQPQPWPRYLRPAESGNTTTRWEHSLGGQWLPLNLDTSACHLSYFEAQAWIRWAGRELPTEAQWERAAMSLPGFHWGDVWEWTSSTFAPYPGFVAHPYRDYSQPWFGSRPVLRGASLATAGRMVHPRYRNYFTPERNDIAAGFRTCKQL